MKNFLSFLLLPAGILHAAPIDVASRISAVTVYADRARVTREAEAALPAGESVVRFTGLPAGLDDSSVQAAGTGSAAFKIVGLEIRDKFFEETLNPRVRELEAQLLALDDQQKDLAAQRKDAGERRAFLQKVRDGLVVAGEGDRTPPQGLEKIKPLYEFYGSEIERLSKQGLALEIAIRELQPKRDVITDELNRLRGSGAKVEKEVLVAVKTDGMTSANLSLSYNMGQASWQPAYDARVNTKDGRIDLASSGVIRQQTGEDWNNVKLSLSTARPSVGARMPELHPWWVQIAQVVPMSAPVGMDFKRDNALLRSQTGFALDKEQANAMGNAAPAEMQTAVIDSSGISTVFEIKLPATIPSDGEPHKVPIATQKFDGRLEYVTTPKLSDLAYLKAKLANTSGAPLLGGEVNLFRDGDFVGKSRLNFIAGGAEFDFFLGVDDGVKVTRKTLTDKASEGGLISKRKGVARKYETTVENFKSVPVKITLLDQLPVSQDASVTVSGVRFSEAPKTQEKDTGRLEWEFTLDPKQKKVITEEFSVEWPADKQVGGL